MAGSGKKTGGKRKSSRSSPRAAKKGKERAAPAGSLRGAGGPGEGSGAGDSGRNAIYVIIILALLTVIVLIMNQSYFKNTIESAKKAVVGGEWKKGQGISSEKTVPDKKGPTELTKKERKQNELIPEQEIKIYLLRFDEKSEKTILYGVRRKIQSEQPVLASLRELIKGPSVREKQNGLLTAVPPGLIVRGVSMRKGVAVLDFNEALEENAFGAILLSRMDQILYTATQFEGVGGIIVQINGRTKKSIGSDGLALSSPLTRKRK